MVQRPQLRAGLPFDAPGAAGERDREPDRPQRRRPAAPARDGCVLLHLLPASDRTEPAPGVSPADSGGRRRGWLGARRRGHPHGVRPRTGAGRSEQQDDAVGGRAQGRWSGPADPGDRRPITGGRPHGEDAADERERRRRRRNQGPVGLGSGGLATGDRRVAAAGPQAVAGNRPPVGGLGHPQTAVVLAGRRRGRRVVRRTSAEMLGEGRPGDLGGRDQDGERDARPGTEAQHEADCSRPRPAPLPARGSPAGHPDAPVSGSPVALDLRHAPCEVPSLGLVPGLLEGRLVGRDRPGRVAASPGAAARHGAPGPPGPARAAW